MNNKERDYVTISKRDIKNLADKGITNLNAVALYCKIRSMATNSKGTGFCQASNAYFADFFNMSERQISRNLATLVDSELISMNVQYQGKRTVSRKIYLGVYDDIHDDILSTSKVKNDKMSTSVVNDDIHDDILSTSMTSDDIHDDILSTSKVNDTTNVVTDVINDHECLGSNIVSFGASQESIEEAINYLLTNSTKVKIESLNNIVKKGIEVSSPFKEKKLYYIAKQLLKNPNTPVYVLDTFSTAYAEGRSVWRDD